MRPFFVILKHRDFHLVGIIVKLVKFAFRDSKGQILKLDKLERDLLVMT